MAELRKLVTDSSHDMIYYLGRNKEQKTNDTQLQQMRCEVDNLNEKVDTLATKEEIENLNWKLDLILSRLNK